MARKYETPRRGCISAAGRLECADLASRHFHPNTSIHPHQLDQLGLVDLDPAVCPILARHWFDAEPHRSKCNAAITATAALRRQRQFEHLYSLGPRAVGESLIEVASGADLDSTLAAYERLTPDLLKAVGGDRFPPVPIHEVSP